jgi:hypothetical protein
MKNRAVLMSGFVALALSGGLIAACGDDDPTTPVTPAPVPTTTATVPVPGTDAAPPVTPDSGADATTTDAQTPTAPITPLTTTRMANAINPYGLVFASDGFLYASGATIDATADRVLAVWRFKDGVLDTTFGTAGVLTVAIPGNETSFDIVEVSAGNFVVHAVTAAVTGASPVGGKVFLVKMTKDVAGAYSFGTPVQVEFDWTGDDLATWPGAAPPSYATSYGVALDKSNAASPKIVVFASGAPAKGRLGKAGGTQAGVQRTDNDRWIARVSADTLAADATFNAGKAYSVDADNAELGDNGRRGIVQAGGIIVSGGYTSFAGINSVVLIRLLANGTADPAFGFGTTAPGVPGQTKFNPFSAVTGGFAEAYGVVRQTSGRYVTGGYGVTAFEVPTVNVDLCSFGVKADGLDPTYGKLGSFALQSEKDKSAGLGAAPFTDRARTLNILADDRVVFGGVYDDYASLIVVDKNGKLDPNVGVNGVIEYAYPAAFFAVAVSPDGKQIAASAQSLNQNADAGAPLGSILATLKVGQ